MKTVTKKQIKIRKNLFIDAKPKLGGSYFMSLLRRNSRKALLTFSMLTTGTPCFASTTDNYAFTQALVAILAELRGPPIILITALGIVAGGFYWIFKGHDVGLKQAASALIGGAIVIAAPTLVNMIPGLSGAVV